jgi:hypothetical protein
LPSGATAGSSGSRPRSFPIRRTKRTSDTRARYRAARLVRGAGVEPSPHRVTVCDATSYTNFMAPDGSPDCP